MHTPIYSADGSLHGVLIDALINIYEGAQGSGAESMWTFLWSRNCLVYFFIFYFRFNRNTGVGKEIRKNGGTLGRIRSPFFSLEGKHSQ